MPSLNLDNGIPLNTIAVGVPIDFQYMTHFLAPQVYWLPNQYLNQETSEYYTDREMPGNLPLHVPKVVRFLYTYDQAHAEGAGLYCNERPEDPEEPEDPECTCGWVVDSLIPGVWIFGPDGTESNPNGTINQYVLTGLAGWPGGGFTLGWFVGGVNPAVLNGIVRITKTSGEFVYEGPYSGAPMLTFSGGFLTKWRIWCDEISTGYTVTQLYPGRLPTAPPDLSELPNLNLPC